MIPRYSRPVAADIWSPQTRYRIWFEIEAHAASAMAELGDHPPGCSRRDLGQGPPKDAAMSSTPSASTRSSATTKHDVIAFLTWHVAEIVGPPRRRASCTRA